MTDFIRAWRQSEGQANDGTRTRVDAHGHRTDGAYVLLYALEGGGHHWPGGDEPLRFGRGNESRDFDAAVVVWDFFRQHPML